MDTLKKPQGMSAKPVELERLLDTDIVYGLVRQWNAATATFDYILRASLPANKQMADVKLDKELGRVLGTYWTQNEHGTFLGRHNMDWILRHLKAGIDI